MFLDFPALTSVLLHPGLGLRVLLPVSFLLFLFFLLVAVPFLFVLAGSLTSVAVRRFRAGGPPPAAREVGHAYRDPSPDPRGPRQPHYGAPDRDPRGGAAPPPAAAGSAATGSGGYYPGSVAPPPAAAPPAAAPWAGRYDAPPPAGAGRYDGYAPAEAGGGGGSYRRGPSAERGAPPAQAMPSAYERHGPPGDGSYPGGRAEGGVPPAPAYGWRGEAPPPAAAPDRYAGGQYAPVSRV